MKFLKFIEKKFKFKFIIKNKKLMLWSYWCDPILNVEKKFTMDVYNLVFDSIIQSIENRFTKNNELLNNLSLLSPTNFN